LDKAHRLKMASDSVVISRNSALVASRSFLVSQTHAPLRRIGKSIRANGG
jgi:hypothetical protein